MAWSRRQRWSIAIDGDARDRYSSGNFRNPGPNRRTPRVGAGTSCTCPSIYWLFPNTPVAVSGPLAGLTVRTGGAFGAYLVVLLLTYGQLQTTDQSINDLQRQFWTVKGTVQLVDTRGNPIMSRQIMDKLEVRTKPTAHSIDMHEIKLRIVEERDGLPLTVIALPEFGEHKGTSNNVRF
jgi:hypothetical protein